MKMSVKHSNNQESYSLSVTYPDRSVDFLIKKQLDPVLGLVDYVIFWDGNPECDAYHFQTAADAARYALSVGGVA